MESTGELNFNSHAHVERDTFFPSKTCVQEISTHTLTWSVTFLAKTHINHAFISTHTLTWSVTWQKLWKNLQRGFQLTRSRGAWLMGCVYPPHTLHFNSHAHVERDKTATLNNIPAEHFNSHAHVERDSKSILDKSIFDISTHTLTWSVTRISLLISCLVWISTHTLTWSVTHGFNICRCVIAISTHTLTWSVTWYKFRDNLNRYHFNSHAHVERDLLEIQRR